ncbi:fungal-specific transcription factor domain-containing protein, partial [Mycena latifolia]
KGAHPKSRAPYAAQACTICRAKKSKCDGVKPVCGSCIVSGRGEECSWGRSDAAPRKPRTEAHFEALRKRADSAQAYADLLEGILAKCVCQDVTSHLQFRPRQLEEPASGKEGVDSETEILDSDEEITQELTVPVQCLKLDDNLGGLLLHGITAPFRFGNRPPNEVSRITDVVEANTCYVLQVDGMVVSDSDPEIDWSRYLPPEAALTRKEHDRFLDLCFKFFTTWCLRIVTPLFLRDMHRALSVPRSQRPPRTPHYSPMLHNALLSLAVIFSDDPHTRDPKTRQMLADAAKSCLEAECQKPDLSFVHALAFLGTYYADIGDRILGDLYFGMSSRLSLSLGLGVDSQVWVKSGLITPDEMLARNWAHWTIFSLDVCWALYFGRDFCGPPSDRLTVPRPFVDSEFDQTLWYHAPAKIPPQPSYQSLTFFESTSLMMIARKIVDTVGCLCFQPPLLSSSNPCSLELNNWRSRLQPQLDDTLANRGTSTPHRLMLHCTYWWCFIVLHRPFLNHRAQTLQNPDQIDHVKMCKRAAENIIELIETWSDLYTLRFAPVTLLQFAFSAGTVFLLLALQATAPARLRIAHASLQTALAQVEQCVRYLHELGQSWRCAARTGDILATVLRDKLKPVIARRLAQKGARGASEAEAAAPPSAEMQDDASAAGEAPKPSLLSLDPATSCAPGSNAQNESDPAWAQIPLDFFTQFQGQCDGSAGFPPAGDNAFPEMDMSGFLFPPSDFFGAPELWDQPPGVPSQL